MKLSQFAQMTGFHEARQASGTIFVDHFLNGAQGDQIREELKLKRIQFDAPPQLSERLESVCSLLDCSKREFLEMAVWEACELAEDTFMSAFKEAHGRDFADVYPAKEGA